MNSIQSVIDEKMCTGCSACTQVCKIAAISISEDDSGFFSASIDSDCCVNCGACKLVCPSVSDSECAQGNNFGIYYGWNSDSEIVSKSTSGGAFYSLANRYLEEGWVIYGCYADYEGRVVKHASTNEVNLLQLLKSKYVQSDFRDCISRIKTDIEAGQKILFCGTPCQCHAVKIAVGDRDEILLIDFLCHGVPSQKLLFDYLDSFNREIMDLDFRDKSVSGWSSPRIAIRTVEGKQSRRYSLDEYMYLFNSKNVNSINPACSRCAFLDRHISDITIGDYWGYANSEITGSPVREGISLIFTNSQKGQDAIDGLDVMDLSPIESKDVEYTTRTMNSVRKEGSLAFYSYYAKHGYKKTVNKYASFLLLRALLGKFI